MLVVRRETADDHEAVYGIVSAAFGGADEADLVTRLRKLPEVISLVAELDGSVVGHIMFSPVQLIGKQGEQIDVAIAGLAPVAVNPSHQRAGVGKALINSGLKECRDAGYAACVLLGHPNYYPKFGFEPARPTFGIDSTYDVPDPVFMALELEKGSLKGKTGTIHYHPTFEGI